MGNRTTASAADEMAARRDQEKATGIPRLVDKELATWLAVQPEPALVLFDAPWSAACRLELDVLYRLQSHFAGRVHFAALDVDASYETSRRFGIAWVPTLILFVAGREVVRWEGARGLAGLVVDVESALMRGDAPLAVEGSRAPGVAPSENRTWPSQHWESKP